MSGTASCDGANSCYKFKSPLHVGETMEFELTSTSSFANEDFVDIQAAVEPGIPNGLEFTPNYQIVGGVQVALPYTAPLGRNTRTVRWTPRPGQQGRTYIASFVGFIPPVEFGGRACATSTQRMHIEIHVPPYESKWLATPIPKSQFGSTLTGPYNCKKSGAPCNGRTDKERNALCDAEKYISSTENYCGVSSDPCCPVESESTLAAPAADLVFSVAARELVEGLTMTCQSTVKTPYMPVLELVNVSVTSPTEVHMLEGQCVSGGDNATCDTGTKIGGWDGYGDIIHTIHEQDVTDPESFYKQTVQFDFKFQPQAGRDEGLTKRWCFACSDSGRMYPPAIQCISITRDCARCTCRGATSSNR